MLKEQRSLQMLQFNSSEKKKAKKSTSRSPQRGNSASGGRGLLWGDELFQATTRGSNQKKPSLNTQILQKHKTQPSRTVSCKLASFAPASAHSRMKTQIDSIFKCKSPNNPGAKVKACMPMMLSSAASLFHKPSSVLKTIKKMPGKPSYSGLADIMAASMASQRSLLHQTPKSSRINLPFYGTLKTNLRTSEFDPSKTNSKVKHDHKSQKKTTQKPQKLSKTKLDSTKILKNKAPVVGSGGVVTVKTSRVHHQKEASELKNMKIKEMLEEFTRISTIDTQDMKTKEKKKYRIVERTDDKVENYKTELVARKLSYDGKNVSQSMQLFDDHIRVIKKMSQVDNQACYSFVNAASEAFAEFYLPHRQEVVERISLDVEAEERSIWTFARSVYIMDSCMASVKSSSQVGYGREGEAAIRTASEDEQELQVCTLIDWTNLLVLCWNVFVECIPSYQHLTCSHGSSGKNLYSKLVQQVLRLLYKYDTYRYGNKMLVASNMYIIMGIFAGTYALADVTEMGNTSTYLLDASHEFNKVFSIFCSVFLEVQLFELLPFIQYSSAFFNDFEDIADLEVSKDEWSSNYTIEEKLKRLRTIRHKHHKISYLDVL